MAAPKEKELVPVMIVFDTETGGLKCRKVGVCQICMHSVRLDTFERTGVLNLYIQPYNKKTDFEKPKKKGLKTKFEIEDEKNDVGELLEYSESAYKVHGLTLDFLRNNGVPYEEAARKVVDFVAGARISSGKNGAPFLVGQNVLFDVGMIQQVLEYAGLWEEFCKHVRGSEDFHGEFQPLILDTMTLAWLALCNSNIPSYELGKICEALGIEIDDAHDADSDVTATEEIVRIFTTRMRSSSSGDEEDSGMVENRREKKREHFRI